ncbi:hypothetical protein Tco_1030122, partial [Tanacetum coccineum]
AANGFSHSDSDSLFCIARFSSHCGRYSSRILADFVQVVLVIRTDCQAIISFYNKTNSNKSSRVRWIKFADAVTKTGVKINIEHIEGKYNTLADSLSRLVNLCFAECTGEMKELAAAALYSAEEVLQSPNAFQKNMKTTCEEVMKISIYFLESSQKLSSHLKNQEHCTKATKSRLIKPQSEWINLMHGDQSPKIWNFQQQKKQLKLCDTYKQSYNANVDPERQLEISRERRANLVPAEVLYSNNRSTTRHRVYEHYSKQRILCVGENQINLRLCNEESYENLRNSGL